MKTVILATTLVVFSVLPGLAQTVTPTTPTPSASSEKIDYLASLTPENTVVLFIDNQSGLVLGVQSMDHTPLMRNTEGLAKLTELFELPVVLTTTGGGGEGPSGPLLPSITETFPAAPIIDRRIYFDAMDDPAFAETGHELGKKNLILSGISTDYCFVYPTALLIKEGCRVFIVTDTSGSWTEQIEMAAQSRLVLMGATLTNVQSIAGEMQNALAVEDNELARGEPAGPSGIVFSVRRGPVAAIPALRGDDGRRHLMRSRQPQGRAPA